MGLPNLSFQVVSVIALVRVAWQYRGFISSSVVNEAHTGQICRDLNPGEEVEFVAEFPMNLGAGSYSVSVALTSTEPHIDKNYQWRDLALVFTVANLDQPRFIGTAWVPPAIKMSTIHRAALASSLQMRSEGKP